MNRTRQPSRSQTGRTELQDGAQTVVIVVVVTIVIVPQARARVAARNFQVQPLEASSALVALIH